MPAGAGDKDVKKSGKPVGGLTKKRDDAMAMTRCPGCGAALPDRHLDPPEKFNASGECWQAFSDLSCYTVARQDPGFIHQHAVDAYEAQHAGGNSRPIAVVFGLIGLYLALEGGFTGKEVQQAHMRIAKLRKDWPRMEPPKLRAALTVADVLAAPEGPERDALLMQWAATVWAIWEDRHAWVRETTDALLAGPGK